ncbi:MAG TPA: SUMF1/EgtB/PvdO family nonheme iron enzyme [Thermoanaerobaculia bacterium]|nr:SUMF1/EgtB/PvdO family nonheme iron enzyme [Thermoanaerobaculia bacterium]
MKHAAFPDGPTRHDLIAWFRRNRALTREVFAIPTASAYYDRPIALRNPIAFYEGHLPAFAVNTLIKSALHRPGINSAYEVLFARGIDPESEAAMGGNASSHWPTRPEILNYGQAADAMVEEALSSERLEDDDVPQLRGGESAITILEHEPMHQETLMYMFHQLPYEKKIRRLPFASPQEVPACDVHPRNESVAIPAGVATLGVERDSVFAWDNELPHQRVDVDAFSIDRHNVTNAEFMAFVEADGYADRALWSEEGWEWVTEAGVRHPGFWTRRDGAWLWRGMFELIPLPADWPVYVAHAEAEAYARWIGKRLPTEAEYHRAAFGTPDGSERSFPWGEKLPGPNHGNFGFRQWEPVPIGSYPAGASAWGVHDLAGNGWEWTSTFFDGFPGFEPMPSYPVYSADFFDRRHFVMKGASPATAVELIRRSFRNWFRGNYPYVYATFRCVE